jgi:hypothetical protein
VGLGGDLTVIDFGDAVHSWTVCEVAILVAYSFLLDDAAIAPSQLCEHVLRGYEMSVQLLPEERAAVFPLAGVCQRCCRCWFDLFGLFFLTLVLPALRLCTSAVITASQTAANPDNPHLTIYWAQVQRVLPVLLAALQPFVQPGAVVRSGLTFRTGSLADEAFWINSVQEVLALEGTVVWCAEEEARQKAMWRAYVSRSGATVALDGEDNLNFFAPYVSKPLSPRSFRCCCWLCNVGEGGTRPLRSPKWAESCPLSLDSRVVCRTQPPSSRVWHCVARFVGREAVVDASWFHPVWRGPCTGRWLV